MKIVNAKVMRYMDEQAICHQHIPSIVLMEHAANALFNEIIKIITKEDLIYIVCGQGNNGGDGLALARMLYHHNYKVKVYCKDVNKLSKDATSEYQMLLGTSVIVSNQFAIDDATIIIDALFGTGLSRNIEGDYAQIIETINRSKCKVFSIDIASGIDASSGEVLGVAIQADITFSFVALKIGNVLYPGKKYSGEIKVLDIHMPKDIVEDSVGFELIDQQLCIDSMYQRSNDSHKGSYGKVLIVGGSSDMHGALYLCAKACLNSGVGLCTLFIPDVIYDVIAKDLKECMCIKASSKDGYFNKQALQTLKSMVNDYELIVVGNGMGRNDVTYAMLEVIMQSKAKVVIDGDAIYELGKKVDLLDRTEEVIITPHMKEMSYLNKMNLNEMKKSYYEVGNTFIKKYPNVTLVLKDYITTIFKKQQSYLYQEGHHALAKGGSGDVLCGMIAGLYAQSKNSLQACIVAVYMHGFIARTLAKQYSAYSILAHDIIDYLKIAYKEMEDQVC